MNDSKLINDICVVSRHGTCLLDMKQVAQKARDLGLSCLAELVERDLQENKITTGKYYLAVAQLLGVQP